MSATSSSNKIFVTGASGFIGSRVVRILGEAGFVPRCLLRPTSNTARLDGLNYERVEGDIRDAQAVNEGAQGCAATIHLASLSSWDDIDSPAMDAVVKTGTQNVLNAAAQAGADHKVVFVSSAVAINGSESPEIFNEASPFTLNDSKLSYCRHKRAAEALCLAGEAPVIIVNPTEVYGPQDTALITAGNLVDFAKSSPVMVCAGGTSVVHVDDVASGIVKALQKGRPKERYILGGENLTVRELAELTLTILGKKAKILQLPNAVIRSVAAAADKTKIPLPFNPKVIPYATRYWFVDSQKAQNELGATFRSAQDTLAPTLAWLKEAGHIPA